MIAVAALDTGEQGLLRTIQGRDMTTDRASLAGEAWMDRDHFAATPRLLILQHATEHTPTLIENSLVQPRLLRHTFSRLFQSASRRLRHIPYLQIFDTNDRVVFADRGRVLVQEIMPTVGNARMQRRDT